MKKSTLIILGIVIVVVIAAVVSFLMYRNAPNDSTGSNMGSLPPIATSTPITVAAPTSTTITLGTNQGGVVMNNFYNSAQYITDDKQTVVLQQDATDSIVYNVADSSFIITLGSTPLEAARQNAESYFLSSLGISQKDACKLSVYEAIPASVSDQYVGQNFSLSFCGGPSTL